VLTGGETRSAICGKRERRISSPSIQSTCHPTPKPPPTDHCKASLPLPPNSKIVDVQPEVKGVPPLFLPTNPSPDINTLLVKVFWLTLSWPLAVFSRSEPGDDKAARLVGASDDGAAGPQAVRDRRRRGRKARRRWGRGRSEPGNDGAAGAAGPVGGWRRWGRRAGRSLAQRRGRRMPGVCRGYMGMRGAKDAIPAVICDAAITGKGDLPHTLQ
jgi:hypothetical protein